VELSVPLFGAAASVESVIRQLTQGVLPERFETAVCVLLPVKVKVNEQSWVCAASGRHTRRAAQKSRRGMAFRKVVMPHILRLLWLKGEGVDDSIYGFAQNPIPDVV
jgi:hypothetical protein